MAIAAPSQKTSPANFEQMLPPRPARRVRAGPALRIGRRKCFGSARRKAASRPCVSAGRSGGGAMREETIGSLTRFRCHFAYVVTAEVLAASQLDELENSLSTVLRTLKEGAALCRDLAAKRRAAANVRAAEAWQKAAEREPGESRPGPGRSGLDPSRGQRDGGTINWPRRAFRRASPASHWHCADRFPSAGAR